MTDTRLAAKYDFGAGTVGLVWDQTKATANNTFSYATSGAWTAANTGALSGTAKQTVWYLPVTFNVGAGKILFQYGHANKVNGDGGLSGLSNYDTSAKHVELGYEYSLSKRTTLKAIYSRITNGDAASYDFLYGVSAPNSTSFSKGVNLGSDPSGISLGLRHSF